MSVRSPLWLATLRRWRRAVLLASLPALLTSALTAGACVAMPAPQQSSHSAHAAAPALEHQHHSSAPAAHPAAELPAPCPHCPLESGAANTAGLDCGPSEAREGVPSPSVALLVPPLAAAGAAPPVLPPLVRAASARASPLPAHVPLNLRYCVLLI